MKTTDEIKKGLSMCTHGADCGHCPYTLLECSHNQMEQDALAYIQQLEAANAELLTKVEQLERERDAAVKALVLVDEKVEQAQEALDNGVFHCVDYSTYLSLRNMVDAILSWHYEDDQRGVKEE